MFYLNFWNLSVLTKLRIVTIFLRMQFSYSCETVMIFQNNESSLVDLPIVYWPKIGSYIHVDKRLIFFQIMNYFSTIWETIHHFNFYGINSSWKCENLHFFVVKRSQIKLVYIAVKLKLIIFLKELVTRR